jgi:hypothetical protein
MNVEEASASNIYIGTKESERARMEVGATGSTKGLCAACTMAAAIPKGKCTGGQKWKPGAMYSNFSVPSQANGERGGGARRGLQLFAQRRSPQSTCLHARRRAGPDLEVRMYKLQSVSLSFFRLSFSWMVSVALDLFDAVCTLLPSHLLLTLRMWLYHADLIICS